MTSRTYKYLQRKKKPRFIGDLQMLFWGMKNLNELKAQSEKRLDDLSRDYYNQMFGYQTIPETFQSDFYAMSAHRG